MYILYFGQRFVPPINDSFPPHYFEVVAGLIPGISVAGNTQSCAAVSTSGASYIEAVVPIKYYCVIRCGND